jgi:5-methylcytosine-specific restriction endonuclease McrA
VNRDTNIHHQSYQRQQERSIANKVALVTARGGRCSRCGYSRNLAALEFHHREPAKKQFPLDARTLANRSLAEIESEAAKCELLCSNCHTEVHHPWADDFHHRALRD